MTKMEFITLAMMRGRAEFYDMALVEHESPGFTFGYRVTTSSIMTTRAKTIFTKWLTVEFGASSRFPSPGSPRLWHIADCYVEFRNETHAAQFILTWSGAEIN